tara:strand:+ start:969 stop:1271 length:303 start_codon:yes stop_codon:yes gene_type:complete
MMVSHVASTERVRRKQQQKRKRLRLLVVKEGRTSMIPAQVKQALKSRTVQYGVAIAVLSVLQGFIGFLPANPAVQAMIGCAMASGIVILRFMTTQPVSEK